MSFLSYFFAPAVHNCHRLYIKYPQQCKNYTYINLFQVFLSCTLLMHCNKDCRIRHPWNRRTPVVQANKYFFLSWLKINRVGLVWMDTSNSQQCTFPKYVSTSHWMWSFWWAQGLPQKQCAAETASLFTHAWNCCDLPSPCCSALSWSLPPLHSIWVLPTHPPLAAPVLILYTVVNTLLFLIYSPCIVLKLF